MTRPEIIRADTIDLQDRDAPSAKGHVKPVAEGSLAPHQAETLREVAAETAEEQSRSPHISFTSASGDVGDLQQYAQDLAPGIAESLNSQQQARGGDNMQAGPRQDALAVAQNGGVSGQEVDDGDLDGETEVDMDDDMMDKISSSPSIEDGGSSFTFTYVRSRSLEPPSGLMTMPQRSLSASPMPSDARSHTPYLSHPEHVSQSRPVRRAVIPYFQSPRRHHHRLGEYKEQDLASESISSTSNSYDADDSDDPDKTGSDRDHQKAQDGVSKTDTSKPERWTNREPPRSLRAHRRRQTRHDVDTDDFQGDGQYSQGSSSDQDDDHGLTVPYDSDQSDDDDDGDFPNADSRFVDSGYGGECLQDTEDIDFEFVYALHTFVATVEGQANATKGDTMVLLDDSNSYWWLVRVVKDSSIGYLPAEHIETPTERLARLNKHRNIDLSATMLGDQADKPRNPLRSAIKRKKAKTVQFAPPTFVDYSDIDYSTEEEDLEAEYFSQQQQGASQQGEAHEDEDETAKVEPLKPRSQQKDSKKPDETELSANKNGSRTSEEIFETKGGDGPRKSSEGTVRDSFFKDDTVETKKITLTPNLLRDDNAPRSSNDSQNLKQRPSLDKLDKDLGLGKDDKKKKDKKPSAIRSFFSRKDKKTKGDEDEETYGKRSLENDYHEKEAEEDDVQASLDRGSGPHRSPSKLQKQQPRADPSPMQRPNDATRDYNTGLNPFSAASKINNVSNVPPASMRIVEPEPRESPEGSPRGQKSGYEDKPGRSRTGSSRTPSADSRPQKATQAKSRAELDDFDSDEETLFEPARQATTPENVHTQQYRPGQQGPTIQTVPAVTTTHQHAERLSESPIHVSPIATTNPPPLVGDSSSQEGEGSPSRSTPSPELVEHEDGEREIGGNKEAAPTPTSTATTSTWNDTSLRAFFDSGSEIRDLLVVVYDKTDVPPAGPDHPVVGSLFKEPNAKLAEITTQLDNMLGDWLARKQRLRGTV